MDSDKKMEEIELLEKALTDCRAFKKWIAGTLSKVEQLNGVANAAKETQNIMQTKKNANKTKKKKNKKPKSKTNLNVGDSISKVTAPIKLEANFSNFNAFENKDFDMDYDTNISALVTARNSHQCLSDYAKINKRYIEVKRSLESLMIDMKRVDDKLKHPKDDFLMANGLDKPSACGCHHH